MFGFAVASFWELLYHRYEINLLWEILYDIVENIGRCMVDVNGAEACIDMMSRPF